MDKYILRYGLVGGLVCMAYIYMLYSSNIRLLVQGWEQVNWLLLFATMLVAGVRMRNPKGMAMPEHTADLLVEQAPLLQDFVSARTLLRRLYGIFVLGYTLKFVFIYALFHYLDPSLNELAQETAVKIFIENRDQNMTEEIFQQNLQAFKQHSFAPSFDLLGLFLYLLIGFIFAFLMAQLLKREQPSL